MGVSIWSDGRLHRRFTLIASLCALFPLRVGAEIGAIADLSLEELADIEIMSVSRRAERLQDAPASIFVITNADIRHSAATTLAEALRLAPNLDIAQVNANSYAHQRTWVQQFPGQQAAGPDRRPHGVLTHLFRR
jgi:outer membrane receptor for ferrienterochelin and colicin